MFKYILSYYSLFSFLFFTEHYSIIYIKSKGVLTSLLNAFTFNSTLAYCTGDNQNDTQSFQKQDVG